MGKEENPTELTEKGLRKARKICQA